MKVIIDLIEDIRESIANEEAYLLRAGLLKEDPEDASRLHYAGEAAIRTFVLDKEKREFRFIVGGNDQEMAVGRLLPSLLIQDMEAMMYPLKVDVNAAYKGLEVVGFAKNDEEKCYLLFIKI